MARNRRHYKENHVSRFPSYLRNPAIIKRYGYLHRQQDAWAYQRENHADIRQSGGRKENQSGASHSIENNIKSNEKQFFTIHHHIFTGCLCRFGNRNAGAIFCDLKPYFSIGFANDGGGYELRNKYFKGSISPKGISTISKNTDTCVVFEGFMDYLSYLTLKHQQHPQTNIVVLNSIILLDKAVDFLKKHTSIHACMDNDDAGRQALAKIQSLCNNVTDQSEFYKNHKDLNEFLHAKTGIKNEPNKIQNETIMHFGCVFLRSKFVFWSYQNLAFRGKNIPTV